MRTTDTGPGILQEERLDAVLRHLLTRGVNSVLDLGCGGGDLLLRLAATPQIRRLVGMDLSMEALAEARSRLSLAGLGDLPHLELVQGSFTDRNAQLAGFDAAALVETIEHIDPCRLSAMEDTVFACYRPKFVLVTTPNREYNALFGMRPGEMRHPGHWFEWGRAKFRQWSHGVAQRNGYTAILIDIGESDPELGPPTQMAVFSRS